MKNAIMAFLLYSFSVIVNAQSRASVQVYCLPTESLMKALQTKYQEQPYWTAPSEDKQAMYMLLFNDQKQTWTFVKFNEDIGCILAAGDSGMPIKSGQ